MKMIVTDLDGTLLRSDKTISDRTINILKELDSHNIKFVVATARAKRSVSKILTFSLHNIYMVYYNGAEIYYGDKLIYHKYIESHVVRYIVNWLINQYSDMNVALEIQNQLYTNFDIAAIDGWTPPYSQVDFHAFDFNAAAKILVDLRGIEDVATIKDAIPVDYKMIVTNRGTLGQISHGEVSKINAVKKVASIFGYDLQDVIAFGDDYNDIEMLLECGKGIVMGNAPDEIKNIAKVVAATNDNDGVAVEIEKILSMQKGS